MLVKINTCVFPKEKHSCVSKPNLKKHSAATPKYFFQLFFSCVEKTEESKAGECFRDFHPVSVYHLHTTRLTGAGYVSACRCNAHVCACARMGSYYLKSTATIISHCRTRPGRKSTKATVTTSAWTCRLCGLVTPGSQEPPLPPPPPPLPLLLFPSSASVS